MVRPAAAVVVWLAGCGGATNADVDAATDAETSRDAPRDGRRDAEPECADDGDCADGWECVIDGTGEFEVHVCARKEPEPPAVLRTVPLTYEDLVPDVDAKLVLVIDNSESMREEQARVAEGLEDLLDRASAIEDLSLEVYVYTTSAYPTFPGEHLSAERFMRSEWSDGSTHDDYLEPPDGSPFHVIEESLLEPPISGNAHVFDAAMTAMERASAREALDATLEAVGVAGSDLESGLCTLGRAVIDDGPNAFLAPGDHVAFLLVSDADDASADHYCQRHLDTLYERVARFRLEPTDDPADAAQANYTVEDLGYTFTFDVVQIDAETGDPVLLEGLTATELVREGDVAPPPSCPSPGTPCSAEVLALIPGDRMNVRDCTYVCPRRNARRLRSDTYDLGVDYCVEPFTERTRTFDDMYEAAMRPDRVVVPGSCAVELFRAVEEPSTYLTVSGATVITDVRDVLPVQTRESLAERLADSLPVTFGRGNFMVAALIDVPGEVDACPALEGVADRYGTFVGELGEDAHAESICESEYPTSVDRLTDFVRRSVRQTFRVALDEGERIGRVLLVRDGVETELTGDDVRVFGDFLWVTGEARVEPGDRLRVEIIASDDP